MFEYQKNWWTRLLTTAVCLLSLVAVTGCSENGKRTEFSAQNERGVPTAEAFAREIVAIVSERDIDALAMRVDAETGLLFSPYAHIDTAGVVILRPRELKRAWAERTVFVWGIHDGSGEPIKLSIQSYFDRFVYDKDFGSTQHITLGRRSASGNSVSNLVDVFPNSVVVEFYFPGIDPRYGGMDWASLLCVLAPDKQGGWFLVGLIHDQWTI